MIRLQSLPLLDPQPARRPEAVRCTVSGCRKATREGKPWCVKHVADHSPYARGVRMEMATREQDARGRGLPRSTLLHDVLWQVYLGHALTVAKLGRCLYELDGRAGRYVDRLERRGLLRTKRRSRGRMALSITEHGKRLLGVTL